MQDKKLAIFDIDGTIFRKNLHFELLTELIYSGVFKVTSKKQINKLYSDWINQGHTYEEHRDKMVELYRKNIIGCREAEIKKVAQKVINLNHQRVYIFTKKLIEELKKKSYHLLIISGSPIEIVGKYAEHFEFDDFFGSIYDKDEKGFYNGREAFVPVFDKGRVVNNFIKEKKLSLEKSVGVGDTESDAKFLELVDRPIAFNPNRELKKIAEKKNWEIIVERKDVIYEINKIL
jgi:HAD superfamily hydrolase (TIGR01490 family)